MTSPRTAVIHATLLVAATTAGCGGSTRLPRPTALAVQVMPPTVAQPVRFELTAAEWRAVEPFLPDLAGAAEHELCKSPMPPFVVEFLERPGAAAFAKGAFVHEPGELTFSIGDGGDERELDGQARFHDAVAAVVRARGYAVEAATATP